jgi:hypothetical protein
MKIIINLLPVRESSRVIYLVITPVLGTLLTITFSAIIETLFGADSGSPQRLAWYVIVSALTIAPLVETFFCQSLPFKFLATRMKNLPLTIFVMAALFGLIHVNKGLSVFVETFFGGAILAGIYTIWYEDSKSRAFKITALTHFLHNVVTLALMLKSGVTVDWAA